MREMPLPRSGLYHGLHSNEQPQKIFQGGQDVFVVLLNFFR